MAPVADDPLVALRAADKRYRWGRPWVLRDINVVVTEGSLVEVRGRNGAGKSTLLRMLAGATLPTRGQRWATDGLEVGYGPERLTPAPPFTAEAYLAHHARVRGLDEAEGRRRASELAERLGLTAQLAREPLSTLSKGSLQKVVVIQALLGRCALVVLDEPFAGLDGEATAALHELLGDVSGDGSAVVFSDHREQRAPARADVVWTVTEGAVRERARVVIGDGLPTLAGVLEVHELGDRIRVLAPGDASDGVLARLLESGWHIVGVSVDGSSGHVQIEATPAERQ